MTEAVTRKYQYNCPFLKRNGQECGSRCVNQLCSKHLKAKSASKYVTDDYLSEVLAALTLKKEAATLEPALTPKQPSKLKQQQSVNEDDSEESSGPTEPAEVPVVIKKPRGRPPKVKPAAVTDAPVPSKKPSKVAAPTPKVRDDLDLEEEIDDNY
jgi:hypothetical protein